MINRVVYFKDDILVLPILHTSTLEVGKTYDFNMYNCNDYLKQIFLLHKYIILLH